MIAATCFFRNMRSGSACRTGGHLRRLALPLIVLVGIVALPGPAPVFGQNYPYDYVLWRDEPLPIPKAYNVVRVIRYLGQTGGLNQAQDLFIDNRDRLYVADTGNNRVLQLSLEGEVLAVFGGEEVEFRQPQGVYVDQYGDILVADTGNERVVHLSAEGDFVEELTAPVSDLLGAFFTFAPAKVSLSPTGYIYVLRGRSIMTMDAGNYFRGYVGQTHVGFSFQSWLVSVFASEEQKDRIRQRQAADYTNFTIDDNGFIYATALDESQNQIKKLNTSGENIYVEQMFGEDSHDEQGQIVRPAFVDITVSDEGIISALERTQAKVYQYDQEGNLLAVFGGRGDRMGRFTAPTSIAEDSAGRLYILDRSMIQVLEPTQFITDVHRAVSLYSQGRYAESFGVWQAVREVDQSYPLASRGLAKALYKQGLLSEALDRYRSALDKDGYSAVFADYRHEVFRRYFPFVVLGIVALVFALACGVRALKRASGYVAERATKKKALYPTKVDPPAHVKKKEPTGGRSDNGDSPSESAVAEEVAL